MVQLRRSVPWWMPGWGVVALSLLPVLMAWGCATPPTYIMTGPQLSSSNRYVGPQLTVRFEFSTDTISVFASNTSDGDAVIRWEQGSFVTTEGISVPLVALGSPLYTLPAGTQTLVRLTLAQWPCQPGTLWNRRTGKSPSLVSLDALGRANSQVKVVLSVMIVDRGGSAEQWIYEFSFSVRPSDGMTQTTSPYGDPNGRR